MKTPRFARPRLTIILGIAYLILLALFKYPGFNEILKMSR